LHIKNNFLFLISKFKSKFISYHKLDEAPKAPVMALNAIDRLLRKLMNNNFPFGGIIIVLGKY
jgi:hypothetical protein